MAETGSLRQERLRKLEILEGRGIEPYPSSFRTTAEISEIVDRFSSLAPGARTGARPRLAGRITAIRRMGRATFLDLRQGEAKIQGYANQDGLAERYELLELLDIGDFLGVEGEVFKTQRGELSVDLASFTLLAKALRPPPEKWHGLRDVEIRYRQRYLDLLANEEVRRTFVTRSRIITAMRAFLDSRGFLEVETPILQPLYGGASARPFETYHHALGQRMFLRISDELYLKRLIVGGYPRVYEIGKDFRNEGISTEHNPEFTVMECYQAFADYHDIMDLAEELISSVARGVLGRTEIAYQGEEIDLAPPWRRVTLREAILEGTGLDIREERTKEALEREARRLGLRLEPQPTWGKAVDKLLSEFVQPKLIQPTFVLDYPVEISPLAKRKASDPSLAERFELFIGGLEMGNAFSELNDPLDQAARFQQQEEQRRLGDEETQVLDEDFLISLEHGMPPTGGLGIGVDRLVMLLTDARSIRDVILFPTLRAPR
ncbi:MAG: lysine--tRNA ligase [Candidatus Acetothermia bacterium]|nr:lysine--tRNA ligase [Candidatus Acetothermia bacterium]MDH7504772.1 lysine--tRNA ligase [Candidatus Acetothermia bacterium]